ncbi:hypothetical protein AT864_02579 [Anoxybacillus sp. P3H1B]|uniref:permease prefix domain 1-containing protein n=1 Tax=Anoxybacillus sp. P3H1B TaxID=1769293 RepID=UPI0007986387|nr:permease prefix domain 1-containing protein [Anoxybacillus sp. P3H1B]KXG09114.1 hypothetical protein AT864_02579 [Anoxybacillus sp. P3H1B]
METILVFLDQMFASMPKTEEVLRLKQQILQGMEERYAELKQAGKSEHEAIGIVISEFGNVDELAAELGISTSGEVQDQPLPVRKLTETEAYDYMKARRKTGLWTGLGILLCVCGVSFLLVMLAIFEQSSRNTVYNGGIELGTISGLLGMFLLVALAVGLFIYSGMQMNRFEWLEEGFQLPNTLKLELRYRQERQGPAFRMAVISGVCLLILSPIWILAAIYFSEEYTLYGVAFFLIMAGIAILLLVYYGNIRGAYTKLLKEPVVIIEQKEEDRVIGMVASIIWPLATALFLFTGFVFDQWYINWVIFPIVGILFGGFCGAYTASRRKA